MKGKSIQQIIADLVISDLDITIIEEGLGPKLTSYLYKNNLDNLVSSSFIPVNEKIKNAIGSGKMADESTFSRAKQIIEGTSHSFKVNCTIAVCMDENSHGDCEGFIGVWYKNKCKYFKLYIPFNEDMEDAIGTTVAGILWSFHTNDESFDQNGYVQFFLDKDNKYYSSELVRDNGKYLINTGNTGTLQSSYYDLTRSKGININFISNSTYTDTVKNMVNSISKINPEFDTYNLLSVKACRTRKGPKLTLKSVNDIQLEYLKYHKKLMVSSFIEPSKIADWLLNAGVLCPINFYVDEKYYNEFIKEEVRMLSTHKMFLIGTDGNVKQVSVEEIECC